MELQRLYQITQEQSKINDDLFLKECLEFYKTSDRAYGLNNERRSGFYSKLVDSSENKDHTDINTKAEADFYVMMTNIWIQSIMSLTDREIEDYKKTGVPKYQEIREIVSKTKQVSSMSEVISLYNRINQVLPNEQEIDDKNYFWRSDQLKSGTIHSKEGTSGFYHVQSRYVNARKTPSTSHSDYRLYINCQSSDAFDLMSLYVQLCLKYQIPYYFKYCIDNTRKDKVIVYCSKELLQINIKILKEISELRPEISKNCGEMLSLVGNIDNWIGIASNPHKIKDKAKFSYNTMRAEILEDAAELTMIEFVKSNQGKNLQHNGQKINYDLNLAKHAAKIIMEQLIKEKEISKDDSQISKYLNEIIRQLMEKTNGISKIDIALKRIEEIMPEKNNLLATNSKPIFTIKLSNGVTFEFSLNTMDKLLKTQIDTMIAIDNQYIDNYRRNIAKKCSEYRVDPENFTFNDTTLDEFKKLDSLQQSNTTSKSNEGPGNKWNKNNFDYVNQILSALPEKLKNQQLQNNMSLIQYVQEVIVDRMDDNHNYINDDGTLIPVEEVIKQEIRRLTHGGKYNENNFFYVNGIISTIPEEILDSRLDELEESYLTILYNNITLRQYFQEAVADRMDQRQNFIDFDGTSIPVTKYILSLVKQISEKRNIQNKTL